MEKPFYYEAKSAEQRFFVLGTMHQGVSASELPDFVLKDFDDASLIAVEADPTDATAKIFVEAPAASYKGLKASLDPKEWEKLRAGVSKNISDAALDNASPYEAFIFLQGSTQAETRVTRREQSMLDSSIDLELFKLAQKAKNVVTYLDKTDSIDLACQMKLLRSTLQDLELENDSAATNFVDELKAMRLSYLKGDEAQIAREIADSKVPDCLLKDRNDKWVKILKSMGQKANHESIAFVAVGTGHLVGPDNMLEILKKEGFEIRRILTEKDR